MITRDFIHQVRYARTLIITALCILLAVSAWGDRGGNRASDRGSRGGSSDRSYRNTGGGNSGRQSNPPVGNARVSRPQTSPASKGPAGDVRISRSQANPISKGPAGDAARTQRQNTTVVANPGYYKGPAGEAAKAARRDPKVYQQVQTNGNPANARPNNPVRNDKEVNRPNPGRDERGSVPGGGRNSNENWTRPNQDRNRTDGKPNGQVGDRRNDPDRRDRNDGNKGSSNGRIGGDRGGRNDQGNRDNGVRRDNDGWDRIRREGDRNKGVGDRRDIRNGGRNETRRPWSWDRDRSDRPRREIDRGRRVNVNINYRPTWYHTPVYTGGFYRYDARPHYRPARYGFWCWNYDPLFTRRSVYFHFGWYPYVQVARVWIAPYVVFEYYPTPVVIRTGGYYLSDNGNQALDNALSDIRDAWMDSRLDLLSNHVEEDESVAVLLDGSYDYSLEPDDYVQMTSDAMEQMQTASFTWTTVRHRRDGAYTAFGKHVYYDADNRQKTVYVSYTLQWEGGAYWITEVGSGVKALD